MSPSTSSSRKRTKTFTGCWTCRSRKLKCDEAPTISILGSAEIDEALSTIDNCPWTGYGEAGLTTTRGPFGVFQVSTSANSLPSTSVEFRTNDAQPGRWNETTLENPQIQEYLSTVFEEDSIRNGHSRQPSQNSSQSPPDFNLTQQNEPYSPFFDQNPYHSPSVSRPGLHFPHETPCFVDRFGQQDLNWPSSGDPTFQYEEDDEIEDPLSLSFYQPRSTFMSHDNRFLLQHYMHKVVKLFCVIDNTKSPWRSFHLPRALQSCGELGAFGATSNARNALLHAILSVSAYILVNNLTIAGQDKDIGKWSRMALQLRYKAIRLLKHSVEHDLHSKSKPKYKELLAAMLSMITIDVVSGDTGTCSLHLSGCEQLIRSASKTKTKYSPKARALHRIFFYLRTIHASTTLDKQDCHPNCQAQSAASGPPDDALETDRVDDDDWLEMGDSSSTDMTSCEYIYGVPQSLLVVMRNAIRVVQLVARFRRRNPGVLYSTKLAEMCDDIDEEILNWPIESELSKCSSVLRGDNTGKIIDHQTRAFHHAIVLYFSQHVRLIHHRHLRPYVESVLSHLEAIEKIKDESKVYAGPLFWPAFIAASEAFDASLQVRFKAWFDRAKRYGFQAAWGGNAIALEVWNKDSTPKSRVTSQWRAIAEERQAELMLT
ncbi:uncharacterized protein Z518_02084 [Rhinocladiella mackenziei CBS 650.93]|uniref:Zn(2)-C6 fungal-type domain-containing protein n=1 Tax=Rhinocladiella mackenziei CBS 650.93 TaxID=1442369 RepID=A0A0D2IW14_9EURO|nr:uncharacterized protein Z518_02084 [Rhinocladiella mackenziei CBS 650.93]KIX07431.1 hypothetical protein Z518_02084 [Rhinocladiella mackenziei CBS 650.93]